MDLGIASFLGCDIRICSDTCPIVVISFVDLKETIHKGLLSPESGQHLSDLPLLYIGATQTNGGKNMSGKIRLGLLTVALLLLFAVGQGSVLAAGLSDVGDLPSSSPSAQPSTGGSYCIATIEPIGSGEASSRVTATRCFDSFGKFATALTHGKLTFSKDASFDSMQSELDVYLTASNKSIGPDLEASLTPGVLMTYVVSIFYDWTNYGSSSYALESAYSGCAGGTTYGFQNLGLIGDIWGWNDRAESVKNYLCNKSTWYQDINYNNWTYSGALFLCNGGACSSFGAMNNQASSARWTN